jgi:hypothetical protein
MEASASWSTVAGWLGLGFGRERERGGDGDWRDEGKCRGDTGAAMTSGRRRTQRWRVCERGRARCERERERGYCPFFIHGMEASRALATRTLREATRQRAALVERGRGGRPRCQRAFYALLKCPASEGSRGSHEDDPKARKRGDVARSLVKNMNHV